MLNERWPSSASSLSLFLFLCPLLPPESNPFWQVIGPSEGDQIRSEECVKCVFVQSFGWFTVVRRLWSFGVTLLLPPPPPRLSSRRHHHHRRRGGRGVTLLSPWNLVNWPSGKKKGFLRRLVWFERSKTKWSRNNGVRFLYDTAHYPDIKTVQSDAENDSQLWRRPEINYKRKHESQLYHTTRTSGCGADEWPHA